MVALMRKHKYPVGTIGRHYYSDPKWRLWKIAIQLKPVDDWGLEYLLRSVDGCAECFAREENISLVRLTPRVMLGIWLARLSVRLMKGEPELW